MENEPAHYRRVRVTNKASAYCGASGKVMQSPPEGGHVLLDGHSSPLWFYEREYTPVSDVGSIPEPPPRFTVGMRVRPSGYGLERMSGLRPGKVTAIVSEYAIRVHIDGFDAPIQYHAKLWEPAPRVSSVQLLPYSHSISIPAEDFHRERTRHLGAWRFSRNEPLACPMTDSDTAAWAAHLRFLVSRSERERQARQPSVCAPCMPDDDDTLPLATEEEMARLPRLEDLR